MSEQRNDYKGEPPRSWIRIWLVAADGTTEQRDLLADTGNPCAVIVDTASMLSFNLGVTQGMETNFGILNGGWMRIQIPELAFDVDVLGYSSDAVARAAKASHSEFDGLAGLPVLRLLGEYGGNSSSFWIRNYK